MNNNSWHENTRWQLKSQIHRTCFFLCLFAGCLHANEETGDSDTNGNDRFEYETMNPVWEFGVDAAAVVLPAYPGSASSPLGSYYLPWFIVRLGRIKIEEEGFTVTAITNDRMTLDVSMTGSLNVSSENAPIRIGMPDIDYLIEVGPELDYALIDQSVGGNSWVGLSWSNSLRIALSTDFSDLKSRGLVYSTDLNFNYDEWWKPGLSLSASAGARWMSEDMMDYLYQVDQEYVLHDRAFYDAKEGYLGSNLNFEVEKKFSENFNLYSGLVIDYNRGSVNRNSPLFEKDKNMGIYMGINWTIASSKKLVPVHLD